MSERREFGQGSCTNKEICGDCRPDLILEQAQRLAAIYGVADQLTQLIMNLLINAMDALERAFEAFFTTKPAGKGTGLGLSLCYSIMKRHEGSIEIDSTPGAGTRVQAFFPIKEIS